MSESGKDAGIQRGNRRRFSIRVQLLLLSVAVLAIPYAGFSFLRELERDLRDSLEENLVNTARVVAAALQNSGAVFKQRRDNQLPMLYVHRLQQPVQLDGYTDDWGSVIDWSQTYVARDDPAQEFQFRFVISRRQPFFYGVLQVTDEMQVLRDPALPDALNNDHVVLIFTNPRGELRRYYFSPSAPGRIYPFRTVQERDEFGYARTTTEYATNIVGVWQPSAHGYTLELALPAGLVGEQLGLVVVDVDDASDPAGADRLGTAGADTFVNPGQIVESSPAIETLLAGFGGIAGKRIWVLDGNGAVLASRGGLEKNFGGTRPGWLYSLVLPPVHERFHDDLAGASQLLGAEVQHALAGETGSRWRRSSDGRAVIVSAAAPIVMDRTLSGAVVVEETTGGIQMLQRRALASLYSKSFALFFGVALSLLLFATYLSVRLRRLGRAAEAAVDEHGRVVGQFRESRRADEIGELSRAFAAMLARLRDYNDYLERMAARLSHELRTPITVVKSSLDNLDLSALEPDAGNYLTRARAGIARLDRIVDRLSEATRIEQAIAQVEFEAVDLNALLSGCTAGYRQAFPRHDIRYSGPDSPVRFRMAPDLIVQMLDKLVANAVTFSTRGRPVEIRLHPVADHWCLAVTNYGPRLPEAMETELFNSMVSLRTGSNDDEPHLGLGLFIVRLIAELHGARGSARNLDDGSGVCFTIEFPKNDALLATGLRRPARD